MEFVVAANGAGQTFTNANIANILSNAQCSTYVNGALVTVADFSIAGSVMTVGRYLRTDDVVSIAPFGVTNMAVTGAGGATTQLQFNDAGNLRGITTATYNGTALTLGSNAQVKITGGTVGQSLVTDGTGNLSWSSTASAAGLDTELQYNNAGASAGIPTATYDGSVLTLGAVDEVSITGGTAGQALITDGSGVLSFGQAMLPGWTNAGPVIIGAVTTAPTKGTPVVDFVRYRKIAPREYQVQMMYSQTTAGSDGSGNYLFTLPAGLQFDFTAPGQRMTPGVLSNTVAPAAVTLGLPGGSGGIVNGAGGTTTWVAQVVILPYSATQFRVFSASSLSTVGTLTTVASDTYKLSDALTGYNWNFSFIATA
jgi:YD repeat-containing protein